MGCFSHGRNICVLSCNPDLPKLFGTDLCLESHRGHLRHCLHRFSSSSSSRSCSTLVQEASIAIRVCRRSLSGETDSLQPSSSFALRARSSASWRSRSVFALSIACSFTSSRSIVSCKILACFSFRSRNALWLHTS